ncbi:hypothetical protein [Glaciibacter sp. 2TAF33]|uniref:hypothetical protein n=1 Tax=Glaciibacter sp. 2TAF33 TaxID=3233015 RepID=UPI003F93ABBC
MTDATGPRFDPRHDPLFQRGFDPAVQPRHVENAGAPPASVPIAATPASNTGSPAAPDQTVAAWPRRNPYLRALWVVGVGLILGGLGLAWQATASSTDYSYSGGEMPLEMLLRQLLWVLIPPMVTVGIATIVALVFWEAAHWRAADPHTEKQAATPTSRRAPAR